MPRVRELHVIRDKRVFCDAVWPTIDASKLVKGNPHEINVVAHTKREWFTRFLIKRFCPAAIQFKLCDCSLVLAESSGNKL